MAYGYKSEVDLIPGGATHIMDFLGIAKSTRSYPGNWSYKTNSAFCFASLQAK